MSCKTHKLEKCYYCIQETCLKAVCPECYLEDHLGHQKTNLKDFQEQTKKIVDDAMETLDKKISELEAKKARDR